MSDIKYNRIDEDLQQKIISDRESHWINPYAFKDEMAVRRNNDIDKANLWRPVFVRDVEKIMHLPYYNRYADKTKVLRKTLYDKFADDHSISFCYSADQTKEKRDEIIYKLFANE